MATRYDSDEVITQLQKEYPATFFETPQMRRPLKANIFDDLVADGFPCERGLLKASLDWYMSHYGYQYALRTGSKRIDLDGKETGTVTTADEAGAKAEIQRITAMRKISHHKPANGRQDDPMTPPTAPRKLAAAIDRAPELVPLYEALDAANAIARNGTQCPALQTAMRSAAIGFLIEEAKRVMAGPAVPTEGGAA
jgi:sRNA-binding protein